MTVTETNSTADTRAVGTVASLGYLHQAVVMLNSLSLFEPDSKKFILIPDISQAQKADLDIIQQQGIQLIARDDIADSRIPQMWRYFDALEFSCALKAYLFRELLIDRAFATVAIVDPDIVFYSKLPVNEEPTEEVPAVLTPHACTPYPQDGHDPSDREIALAGYLNAGYWVMKRGDQAAKILEWIIQKVTELGFFFPAKGLYSDQTWISAIPWFFPDVTRILRHPGFNVAYWNLHERRLQIRDGRLISNESDLIFMHFSGFDPKNPGNLSRHTRREFDQDTRAVLEILLKDYASALNAQKALLPKINPVFPFNGDALPKRLKTYTKLIGKTV